MEKQINGVRVLLTVESQEAQADCSVFIDSYGPPARWRGKIWAIAPAVALHRGTKASITLPQDVRAEIVIQTAGVRGSYDFQGDGLPPPF